MIPAEIINNTECGNKPIRITPKFLSPPPVFRAAPYFHETPSETRTFAGGWISFRLKIRRRGIRTITVHLMAGPQSSPIPRLLWTRGRLFPRPRERRQIISHISRAPNDHFLFILASLPFSPDNNSCVTQQNFWTSGPFGPCVRKLPSFVPLMPSTSYCLVHWEATKESSVVNAPARLSYPRMINISR